MTEPTTRRRWTSEEFRLVLHLSVAEAAREAGVTPAVVRKAIEDGTIAATTRRTPSTVRWMVPVTEVPRITR